MQVIAFAIIILGFNLHQRKSSTPVFAKIVVVLVVKSRIFQYQDAYEWMLKRSIIDFVQDILDF